MNSKVYISVFLLMMPALAFSAQMPKFKTPQEQLDQDIFQLQQMLAAGKELSGKDFYSHHTTYEDKLAAITEQIKALSSDAGRPETPPIQIYKKTYSRK